ncbi:MAG: sugar phosphate nucleotidyltransferase [Candidatus Hydrothermarchaeales archaeon]
MQAVVLAGGQGTRLWPLSLTKPKPMISLANKPILHHIIEYLKGQGFGKILITTNYLKDVIQGHFGDGEGFGVEIDYPLEDIPLDTAGSVKNTEELIDGTFVVIQGDNITDIDLSDVYRSHKKEGLICTITLVEVDEPWEFGVAELRDQRIKDFVEKPEQGEEPSNLVNSGIYVLEPEVLGYIPENEPYDFAKDLFPHLLREGVDIHGYCAEGFWTDIGSPAGYYAANEWMLDNLNDVQFSETTFIGDDVEVQPPSLIGDVCMIEDGAEIGPYSVIGDNSIIHEGARITKTTIFENSSLGGDSHISSSIIGENVVIRDNAKIMGSVIGGSCRFGRGVEIGDNSRIWPNTTLISNSIVRGELRRFISHGGEYHEGDKCGPSFILRTVSDEEAFYFNKQMGNDVVFTGMVAKNLDQFLSVLRSVEVESLEHHIEGAINDFEAWVKLVIRDSILMSQYRLIGDRNLRGEILREALIQETDKRCTRLREYLGRYYTHGG